MRFRSSLVIVAVGIMAFAMPSLAATTLSMESDSGAWTAAANPYPDFGQGAPSWSFGTSAVHAEFTNTLVVEGLVATEIPYEAMSLEGLASLPPEQARSEARVPEPATLVFVGTGLIGISRFARRKRPEWKVGKLASWIRETASQEA